MKDKLPGVSVIMPTHNYGAFILRALASLQDQSYCNWELIIIDDGSTDYTRLVVSDFLSDPRITYYENKSNLGLGASLNIGIHLSSYDYIAYLPSDDIYYPKHLEILIDNITSNEGSILCCAARMGEFVLPETSKIDTIETPREIANIQLVQVIHRKSKELWIERNELVTNDLAKMYWRKLIPFGKLIRIHTVTCEQVKHPEQRSNIINKGIYSYKRAYKVNFPIRFQSSTGNFIDEIAFYSGFRVNKKSAPQPGKKLNILIVGELAFNPERICALEEAGHTLFGLWITDPSWYNAVGPLPFGNVIEIEIHELETKVVECRIDIIYASLNYQAVNLAHNVLFRQLGIPFVWHFKESPLLCREYGLWTKLVELFTDSDGHIYINEESKCWYDHFLSKYAGPAFILDGDLPKSNWFTDDRSEPLSSIDGEPHIAVTGRPFGLTLEIASELISANIHIHFYGELFINTYGSLIGTLMKFKPKYVHIHPHCDAKKWVKEYSKYDAGWGHVFVSANYGEISRMGWDDMNYPARIPSLISAGLPIIQRDNTGHIVASQTLLQNIDGGIFFGSTSSLIHKLKDKEALNRLRENVWKSRAQFTFDKHVNELISFFFQVIESYRI